MQQRIHAVAPALASEQCLLVHFNSLYHVHYGKHFTFGIIFLGNVLISDKNVLTLCISIGFEILFVWYLKDSCDIRKKSYAFLCLNL